jgi:pimeloyl-ACP methyl ester carboxylesterase
MRLKEYAQTLKAPEVSFTLFEKSGHSALFEEPENFNRLVKEKFLQP